MYNYVLLCSILAIINLLLISYLVYRNLKTSSKDSSTLDKFQGLNERFAALESNIHSKFEHLPNTIEQINQTSSEKTYFKVKESLSEKFYQFGEELNSFKSKFFENTLEQQNKSFKNLNQFKSSFQEELRKDFHKLNELLEQRMDKINQKVQENLDEGFKKTNQTFTNIIERLSKIDEAQKKIESLSANVVSLQDVLTDKKSRGIFGEVWLNQVLSSVFGESNDKVYKLQHKLSTGVLVDAMLFLPEPTGNISVDSKFPLENYQRMVDVSISIEERQKAQKNFKQNIKKHIDDISSKYIIPNQTSDQAIMFLPAEAIFAEINAYHPDLIEYSNKKKVWITSPTTFMAVLTSIQILLQNIDKNKYVGIIQEELNKLGVEFKRYQERWNNLSKNINRVSSDVKDIHTTSEKISKRFSSIENVKLTSKSSSDNLFVLED